MSDMKCNCGVTIDEDWAREHLNMCSVCCSESLEYLRQVIDQADAKETKLEAENASLRMHLSMIKGRMDLAQSQLDGAIKVAADKLDGTTDRRRERAESCDCSDTCVFIGGLLLCQICGKRQKNYLDEVTP